MSSTILSLIPVQERLTVLDDSPPLLGPLSELPEEESSSNHSMSVDDDDELVYPPYLSTLGIAINMKIRAFICSACEEAVHVSALSNHLMSKHRESNLNMDPQQLEDAVEKYDVVRGFPAIPNFVFPPIQGLAVVDGYVCNGCGYCCGQSTKRAKDRIMKEHISSANHTLDSPKPTFQQALLQRFTSAAGSDRSYWACKRTNINKAEIPHEVATLLEKTNNNMDKMIAASPAYSVDARFKDPWLLTSDFHKVVEGHDIPTLKAWVAPAARLTWETRLTSLVLIYLNASLDAKMDEVERMKLNTANPQEGCKLFSQTQFASHANIHF
jgi:hypothetical protein